MVGVVKSKIRLIFGDQLNVNHSWFKKVDDSVLYLMMEVNAEAANHKYHAQKLIGLFASMRSFAAFLEKNRHQVRYLKINQPENQQDFVKNISHLVDVLDPVAIEWQEPDSWYLARDLNTMSEELTVPCSAVSSEHFFEEKSALSDFMLGKKTWRMEHWYRHLRVKHKILMVGNEPEGGKWNYDHENRKAWRGNPEPPIDKRPSHDHTSLWNEIREAGINTFGEPSEKDFRWPIDRKESLAVFKFFLENVLPNFGRFQDAMSTKHAFLFHSLISYSLNIKLISPGEVVKAVNEQYANGKVELESAEGFIRQILGWREYIRGIYWARMPDYLESNFFDHSSEIPNWFWTGNVKMNCMSQAINQSLKTGYAHHIQRLMVVGNFALLAGLAPKQVHEWYLGIYIDAFEWVEVPNTLGMSQFADGGLLASKPYVSSSAYIHRMSDYCKSCNYDRKQKLTDSACPFDALYWNFLIKNKSTFKKNARMAMMMKNLEKKTSEEIDQIKNRVATIMSKIENL